MSQKSKDIFIAEGVRTVESIIQSKLNINKIVCLSSKKENKKYNSIINYAVSKKKPVIYIDKKNARKYFDSKTPQGICAVIEKPEDNSLEKIFNQSKRILVLDGLNDPGNAGGLVRTAVLLGWDAVLTTPDTVSLYNPKSVRASAGAIGFIQVKEANAEEINSFAKKNKFAVILTSSSGGNEHINNLQNRKVMLILGSEATGIKSNWNADSIIKIPMKSIPVDSLGVLASGAIVLYKLTQN